MSGTISYVFYAIDKPLSPAQRAQVRTLSSRVRPTTRRAEFWYQVEGNDIPNGYEALAPFECEAGDGCGVLLEKLDAKSKRYSARKVARPTRLLVEISGYLDYDVAESLTGLRALPWERPSEHDGDDDDEEDWDDEWDEDGEWADYSEGSIEENLARLANLIREGALHGDLRAFYLVWKKFSGRQRGTASKRDAPTPAALAI